VGDQQVPQGRNDRDGALGRPTLGLDLALLSIPSSLDSQYPASQIDVFPAEGLRLAESQTGIDQRTSGTELLYDNERVSLE
jgi:hypothetical protein